MAGETPSIRDALAAAWDAAGSSSSSDTGAAAVDTAAARPDDSSGRGGESTDAASSSAAAPTESKQGAARDASGRFASGAGEGNTGAGAAVAGADGASGSAAPAIPDGWDPAVWAALAPAHQAAVSSWASKAIGDREAKLKGWEPVERVLATRRDALTATYGGVDRGLEQLLGMSDFAGRDPAGFVKWFAQQRGLNLGQLAPAAAQGQGQARAQAPSTSNNDPRALVSAAVEQALAQREVDNSYREFIADSAAEHRNDPTIKRVMAALLQAGTANDYRTAYGMAVQAHPELGPKHRAAEAASAAQASVADRAKAASAKVQAAVSVTGAPGTARPAQGGSAPSTVRAALETAWATHAGGARV
jgi:hypothetical protein